MNSATHWFRLLAKVGDGAALRYVAGQLGRPSGLGALLLPGILNDLNRGQIEEVVKALDVKPGERALDVGFGGGRSLELLLERAGGEGEAAGVDLSEAMVRRAGRRFAGEIAAGRLSVRHGSVESLPFDDARFDKICTINTVYFWPDPMKGLREIRRVLKPGGRFVLAFGDAEDMRKLPVTRHGFAIYTTQEAGEMLGRAGFDRPKFIELKDQAMRHHLAIADALRSAER